MNKKIIKAIVIVLSIYFALWGCFMILCPNEQTGIQWFANQNKYIEDIAAFTDNVDTITTLYISGNISEVDFLKHISALEQQYEVLEEEYETALEQNPVKIGTHSYLSKVGCESVENSYKTIKDLLLMLKTNSGNTKQLSYKYLAYKQDINQEISKYILARYYMFETQNSQKNTEENNE